MKKINDMLIFILGICLFLLSYIFDLHINLFLKNIRSQVLNIPLSIVTNFGVVILIMLLVPSFILYKKNKKVVYSLWLTFIVSFVLSFIIKLIVLRQRPIEPFSYPFTNIINYSFPSMHSMVVFSLLPFLTGHLFKQRIFWIAFAITVVFSRVYLEFHYLSDVVFGALTGYFIGNFLLALCEKGKLWKK